MFEDVAADIPWARIALDKEPDAVNMWIGSARSTTALHRDPYQNIYVQIVGAKRFVLVPPAEMACVNERMLPVAAWVADGPLRDDHGDGGMQWRLEREEAGDDIPCALWDPDVPEQNGNEFSRLCRPLRVELNAGDMLYLPVLWYATQASSSPD